MQALLHVDIRMSETCHQDMQCHDVQLLAGNTGSTGSSGGTGASGFSGATGLTGATGVISCHASMHAMPALYLHVKVIISSPTDVIQ